MIKFLDYAVDFIFFIVCFKFVENNAVCTTLAACYVISNVLSHYMGNKEE